MKRLLAGSLAAALAAATALSWVLADRAGAPARTAAEGLVPIGGPFELVDGDGRTRRYSEFRGAPMLVNFGYTHCPDVCPTTLQTMTDALETLGPEGAPIQPLFITVDPERDTPAVMREYVGHFHERLIGLTGSVEQAAAAARAWRVAAMKAPGGDGEHYLMDHTALVYLMGPDGAYVTHFGHGTGAEAMAARLADYLERLS